MALRLYNTLSNKIEEFRPLRDNEVRMYACGPTVYDYGHIGNFRTFVAVDILHRYLVHSGFNVRHVMNITDVDDRIIQNSARDGVSVKQYTAKYDKAFLEDAAALNIEQPIVIRATDHIQEMASFIAELQKKGFAYRAEDGSYYFRIAKFPGYGKLSKKDFAGMEDGARVDVDNYDKDSARDFALWKAPKPGEASWETSIGRGRPGWHIECSVMSMEQLGETFDLHAGGEDLIFPHHENEIAQSEALTGKPFSHFWFHARFLLVEGEKMSKSLGNFFTLRDLVLKGHKPSSIRFLLASVPYRNQLNFTFDGLKQAAVSVERLRNFQQRLTVGQFPEGSNPAMRELSEQTTRVMIAGMNDDLNTAQAQAAVFDMVRKANVAIDAGAFRQDDAPLLLGVLNNFDQLFAVLKDDDRPKMAKIADWAKSEGREKDISPALLEEVSGQRYSRDEIDKLVGEMEAARKSRDYLTADIKRFQLANAASMMVSSTASGTVLKPTSYKTSIYSLRPLAIKLGQLEVHGPDHDTWGIVSCDGCKDRFAIGPNRIYGSRAPKEKCVAELEELLRQDHLNKRPHQNSYEVCD